MLDIREHGIGIKNNVQEIEALLTARRNPSMAYEIEEKTKDYVIFTSELGSGYGYRIGRFTDGMLIKSSNFAYTSGNNLYVAYDKVYGIYIVLRKIDSSVSTSKYYAYSYDNDFNLKASVGTTGSYTTCVSCWYDEDEHTLYAVHGNNSTSYIFIKFVYSSDGTITKTYELSKSLSFTVLFSPFTMYKDGNLLKVNTTYGTSNGDSPLHMEINTTDGSLISEKRWSSIYLDNESNIFYDGQNLYVLGTSDTLYKYDSNGTLISSLDLKSLVPSPYQDLVSIITTFDDSPNGYITVHLTFYYNIGYEKYTTVKLAVINKSNLSITKLKITPLHPSDLIFHKKRVNTKWIYGKPTRSDTSEYIDEEAIMRQLIL